MPVTTRHTVGDFMEIKIVLSGRVLVEATHNDRKQRRELTVAFQRRGKFIWKICNEQTMLV